MIRDLIHTATTAGAVLGLTTTLGPLASVVALPDPRNADPLYRLYATTLLRAAGVRHRVRGLENIPGGTCVFVCNHQSHFDVLVLFAHLPGHARVVAKAELFKIPIFGAALKATGNIRVDRSGGEKDRETLLEAVSAVRERVSVVFFPEGTRSDTGELKPFKKGAAMLAILAGVPVVPIAVAGTGEILPKGSKWIHGGKRAVLRVGEPIPTRDLKPEDRDQLTARMRDAVQGLLDEANLELAQQ